VTSPYTHPGLTNGVTYYYVVTAMNHYLDESGQSDQGFMAPGPPAAPTGVTAVRGVSNVSLTWNNVYGATSYNVYVSLTDGVTKLNGSKIPDNIPNYQGWTEYWYQNNGLADGTTYYYVVTAVNGGGESLESLQVSGTTVQRRTIPDTGQIVCSNASGTTIACPGQGQDGSFNWNTPAYRDNSVGTITDLVTGLLWQKQDDATQRTWSDAATYCSTMNLGGNSTGWRLPTDFELLTLVDFSKLLGVNNGMAGQWRLPNIKELASIEDKTKCYPTLDSTYFPNVQNGSLFATSTSRADNYTALWFLGTDFGGARGDGPKADPGFKYHVRCVR